MNLSKQRVTQIAVAGMLAGTLSLAAASAAITGPSSSQSPYIVPTMNGVVTKSILTVGDAAPNGYRMVGIPDGLGAFDNGDGTFTVLMNHELRPDVGAVRAHGATGAFVSKWTIRKGSLEVLDGADLIHQVATWNTVTGSYNAPASGVPIARLCSADLPAPTAFYDAASSLGTTERLFMNGEETGAEGRAFAHTLGGTSYELPRLGKFSWENALANPAVGTTTIVAGTDDTTPGQVYVYVGTKTASGSPVDRAGLTNGALWGVKVANYAAEPAAGGIPSGTRFTLHPFGNVENTSGAQLQTASVAAGVTEFLRPEDGAWDARQPNDFYFVTTASFTGNSRLWRLRFDDIAHPAAGGTIDMLLDGSEGQRMMDNLTITDRGQIFIQEDPGGQARLAQIWRYDIARDTLQSVAQHNPARFTPGAPDFLTIDEESSGILDISDILGTGKFLLDVQAHYSIPGELVEGGQLLVMQVPPGKK